MASKAASIKVNMVMNALLTMSSVIFPLITYPYVSRILLPAGVGKVYFATSLVTYFAMFAQMGVPVYGIRACAKVRDNRELLSKTVKELLSLNLLLCVPVYMVYTAALLTVPKMCVDKGLFLVVGASILLSAINTDWFYQAIEKYSYITFRSVVFKSIALAAMFAMVRKPDDYIVFGGISIFAAGASSIWNLLMLGRHIDFKTQGRLEFKEHMRMTVRFFMLSVMTTIYTNLDVVMLGLMTDDATTGCYGTAVKIKLVLVAVITSVSAVLLPRASYYIENHMHAEIEEVLRKTMNLLILVSVSVTLYFVIFARECILLLAGDSFGGAVLCMQIITFTIVPIAISNLVGFQILVPAGRELEPVKAAAAGAAIDLAINILLIPAYGASGAAIGTLAAELAVTSMLMYSSRSERKNLFGDISLTKLAAASVSALAGGLLIKQISLGLFWNVAVSAVIFFGIYFVSLLAMKEKLVKELWKDMTRRIR